MRLFDAKALYEKASEWEAQTLRQADIPLNYKDPVEWKKWFTIVIERSAFKNHVIDSLLFDPVTIIQCDERNLPELRVKNGKA